MKRKDKLKRREKYSHAFFLFGQCHSPEQVAHKLDIPYKEAKKIYTFYLYSQKLDEKMEKDITAYYEKKLENKEVVERIKKNVKEERQKDLNRERISRDSTLLLDYLYEEEIEVIEIFFYNRSGVCFAHWAKKEWEHSPFWMNFESRFYSNQHSCYLFN